jgi:FecR protein
LSPDNLLSFRRQQFADLRAHLDFGDRPEAPLRALPRDHGCDDHFQHQKIAQIPRTSGFATEKLFKERNTSMTQKLKKSGWWSVVLGPVLATMVLAIGMAAQDQYQQQDDPPSRVARIGYMEGSVSFQPAGETEWVQAVANRPMTTGDKIWADKDSRAELQLGSAVIRLSANTGFSFLNLDDHTAQIQLTSGTINIRVRRLDQNDIFEIDTPNLAFSVTQPGSYRVEASEDGTYSVVSPREGGGQATGNGQTYTLHAGQRGTFSGTDSLNADVIEISGADQFDNWAYNRDHRYDNSRSARYLSHDVVGYEDLDDNGDWRDDSNYGHVWYPNRVEAGWAPYHQGHWEWIAPWGYTWVDDSSWGYAPFHYGRWVTVGGRWGWVAGPVEVQAVYAPALVVFIGGGGGRGVGIGVGFGGDVGWFPLGPREVYVPSYHVSREYVNRVNISNTTVNTTTVTNIYNTTIINNNTNNTTITNVTYANRNVQGAVTVVPQRAFASAQPVARAAVVVNAQQIAAAPVSARVAVAPTRESVLGAKAATANHVTAPPPAVMNRPVIAKTTPPPPPVPFAKQQQALAEHPGQPLAKHEVQTLRPAATAAAAQPMVKVAPPGKPATPTMGRPASQPGNQPGSQPNAGRPGQPASNPPANQPSNRPGNQPAPNERPGQPGNQPNAGRPGQPASNPPANQPSNRPGNQPAPTPSQPNNRPDTNRPPTAQPNNRPETNQPNNRPEANRPPAAQPNNRPVPQPNQPAPSQPNNRPEANRPPAAQPNNRPEPNQPNNRPETNRPPATPPNNRPTPQNSQPEPPRPQTNRPEPTPRNTPPPAAQPNNRPEPNRNQPAPAPRPQPPAPPERQQQQQQQRTPPPAASRPTPPPPPAATKPAPQRPLTPEEKKQEEERKKREQQKPPGE